MPVTNVRSRWSSGALIFHEADDLGSGANILTLDTTAVTFGSATQDVDVMIYLGAADQYVKFDAGAATMTMSKVDVNLGADLAITVEDISLADGCSLEFGTDKDIDAQWVNATAILQISPVADDTGSINIGDGTKDIDFKVFLGTAAKSVLFDVGNSCVTMSAGTSLDVDDATDASSVATGSVHTDGGLGVTKKVYVGTDLVMVAGDIDMTTAGTGTYDLLLKDAVADALSIKRGGTDMVVFNSTAPSITITPATTIMGAITCDSVTDATTTLTGSIQTDGGLGVVKNAYIGGRLVCSAIPTAHTDSTISAGVYGTPLVDATLVDNILVSVNYSTATNKTAGDTSCMAAYIGVSNTAHTTNNKIQGLLVSNSLGFNCYDAYAVQGHITIGAGGVSTQNANGHITGLSGKALLSGAVGQGWVTGVLGIIDGAGAVTGLCHAIAGVVEATTAANACDAVCYLNADQTVPTAIEFAGTANMTNIFKFNAVAGGVVANALVPAAAPDAGTMGADAALVCDVGGTPYYIPMYNSLHI